MVSFTLPLSVQKFSGFSGRVDIEANTNNVALLVTCDAGWLRFYLREPDEMFELLSLEAKRRIRHL